jgi:hypothetical protein
MSDKLKQSISVVPEFVEGETPSPAKLNAIGAQLELAASQLELAIGDIRGDSWPYTAASTTKLGQEWGRARTSNTALSGAVERFLDIANVGRLIGPASNLNPHMLGATTITEPIPVGVHEFSLRYPVSGTIDITNPDLSADPSLTIFVGTKSALDTAGQYTVDSTGKVFCVTATAGGNAVYTTDPAAYAGGLNPQGASFNVIPDPNQLASGSDIAITGPVSGVYTLTLPTVTQQQRDINGSTTVLDGEDANYLVQLELPEILQSSLVAGNEIPTGFLFLKNYTTGEAYVDGVYKYNNASTLTVENVDLASAISAGHKFVVVTIGSDITTAIDDLRQKGFHSHDRTFGEPFVELEGITGFISKAGASGPFVPSENASNFAPQYLHRDGFRVGVDDNLNDENVMRGHLVLGAAAGTAGSYVGSGESFGIFFGGNSSIPLGRNAGIYRDSDSRIVFESDESSFTESDFHFNGEVSAQGGYRGRYTGSTVASLTGVTGVAVHSVMPIVILCTANLPTGTGDSVSLDVTSALGGATIAHVSVAIQQSAGSTTYRQLAQASTDTYEMNIAFNTSTNVVSINFEGPSWSSGNHQIRLIVWTYI